METLPSWDFTSHFRAPSFGIGWAFANQDDTSARIYGCFVDAESGIPLAIPNLPQPPYEIVPHQKWRLLCRRPSDGPLEDQLEAVIDEVRRLSPDVTSRLAPKP